MNKLLIIIMREYLTRLKTKSFILITLLMPFLMIAMYVGPIALAQVKDNSVKTVLVDDKTNLYLDEFVDNDQFAFMKCESGLEPDGSIAKVLITDTLSLNPKGIKISFNAETNPALIKYVEGRLNARIYKDKLEMFNVPELQHMISKLNERIVIETVKVETNGQETKTNTDITFFSGLIFTTLIFMFVTVYGSMVMQSVLEEKTSRIVEIIVSSIKPFQLMLGKIVGIFLLGITQIAFWGIMYGVIIAVVSAVLPAGSPQQAVAMGISESISSLPIAEIFFMFVVYFIGGYLLMASIYAAVGSSVNSSEEAQQFNMPIMMIVLFGFYAGMFSMENTDGPLAFWASMIPLTSPIVMMTRIPFGVPLWQEIVSLTVLYLSAFAMLWVGAKIYRIGILMYGKKPSVKEILKWISYK